MSRRAVLFVCVMSTFGMVTDAARILAVLPYPSHSHQIVFHTLTKELWRRGHELVIFTTHPISDIESVNYTQIDLSDLNNVIPTEVNFIKETNESGLSFLNKMYSIILKFIERVFSDPYMERLVHPNSTEKFDVVIVQTIYMDAFFGLSHRFNAPSIGITSLLPLTPNHYMIGNPIFSPCIPDLLMGYTDKMSFFERIQNFIHIVKQIYVYEIYVYPEQDKLMKKYLGNDTPYLADIARNISIYLSYANPFFMYPRPNVPSLIFFGGSHLNRHNQALPNDLKKILDESNEGVIYFSLGSNVKSVHIPDDKRAILLSVFAELPYKVIWKFEDTQLSNKSSNVIIRKWLPQQAVLAHPNVVLFMYQGGMQSTGEAIECGVPMIGFPVFSDQTYNVKRLEYLGVAKYINIHSMNREALKRAILELITDPRSKEKIIKLRAIFRDLPYDPLQNAVWWIEHVIRHKGAPHLYNMSREIPFYQAAYLDIIGVFIVTLLALSYMAIVIIKQLYRLRGFICRRPQKNVKTE